MSWAWFDQLNVCPDRAYAAACATEDGLACGFLVGWPQGPRPTPTAIRLDARVLDPGGEACVVSLVLPPADRAPLFDDPAVSAALRAVLAGPAPDAVTTFVRDSTHFAGAVTVRRGADAAAQLAADPFARLAPARVLRVDTGLFGRAAPPPGPVIQRYGGKPWPAAGF